jgi:hypothetical protein
MSVFIARLFDSNDNSIEGIKVIKKNSIVAVLFIFQHLETFSCEFYLKNVGIDDMTGIGHFCAQLEEIFNSQEGANKKSLKFALGAYKKIEWQEYEDIVER